MISDGNPTLIAAERLDIAGQEREKEREENLTRSTNLVGNTGIKRSPGRTPPRPFAIANNCLPRIH
jgi:hypothetical protein